MASHDKMPLFSKDEETVDRSEVEHMSNKLIDISNTVSENHNTSTCQTLFDKFERFKQTTIMLSNSEDMKKKLNQSISLWNELLHMANNVNERNKCYFDQNRVLLTKVFSDVNKTDLFSNDNHFSRLIFFDYLNILNTHEIQHFITASSLTTLADSIRESNVYILLYIISNLCTHVSFVDDDIADKYNTLFNAMRLHIERKLQNTVAQQNTKKASKTIHERILSLLWNLSDRTVVVPSLLHAGFGESVLEWVKYPTLSDIDRRPMVSIIHNLSRHDDGADELNKYGAIETIKQLQKHDTVRQSKMSLLTTMALALLYTHDQIKADPTGSKSIFDQLLQTTINASDATRYRHDGFHVSEPLAVLVKLFVDDSTFDYVMNQVETKPPSNPTSTIQLFSDLLIRFHVSLTGKTRLEQFTFIALSNILWSISFHEIYHGILKQNTELMNTIKNVAKDDSQIIVDQYVPRSMQSVKKAADGILFNLGFEISQTTAPVIQQSATGQQKPLVMLSYSHANDEFCDRILELIDQKADLFDVWIDKRYCKSSADVWESIAKGIRNAQLIICIVSSEYLASKACRQEIIYAKDRLNKRFLPVYLEKPDISDWLDIRLAEFKYVRFQNTHLKLDERKVEEFLSTIMESILPGHSAISNVIIKHHHSPPTHHKPIKKEVTLSPAYLTVSKPIEIVEDTNKSVWKWTQGDIHHWFAQHDISLEIRDMYQFKTGAQMITYADCFKDGWQKQYERYAPRYAQRYAGNELPEHEFALFASALKQLSIDSVQYNDPINQQRLNVSVPIVTDNRKKSVSCILL